jgi:CRP/FNR family cyclic AMP-dependent transcriptional regulator
MQSDLQPLLERHPFFADMPAALMALLTGCAKNVRFDTGELLVRAGDDADHFFLVRKGRVSVTTTSATRELVVGSVAPGELVGWSWIVAPYRHRFDARAAEPTLCFELDGACLRRKCDTDPRLGYELLRRVTAVLGQQLEDLQLRLLDVYGDSAQR